MNYDEFVFLLRNYLTKKYRGSLDSKHVSFNFERREILKQFRALDRDTLELYLEELYPTYFVRDDGLNIWFKGDLFLIEPTS